MVANDFDLKIEPQPGFQQDFLSTEADICIGGGAAGAGKTFVMLLECLRWTNVNDFGGVIFRRNLTHVKMQGGLKDESMKLFPEFGGQFAKGELKWYFQVEDETTKAVGYSSIKFDHLTLVGTERNHQGAQYCFIGFDELQHFVKEHFTYLLTRNRSMCGVKPYVRATCNPDPDSWLANYIEWWIEQDPKSPNYGFPIVERAGKLRYMVMYKDNPMWGDSKAEVYSLVPGEFWDTIPDDISPADMIKSVTFIPGSIYENKALLKVDPGYLGNLMGQDDQTQSQLLHGNWKIVSDGNSLFIHRCVMDLFSNYVPSSQQRYITADIAKFGRDYTVIMVWIGWQVVKIVVITKNDENMAHEAIEGERKTFRVPLSNTLIDQNGVGGSVVELGHYQGFNNGAPPMKDPVTGILENYENLKTQCYYRMANRTNGATVALAINSGTCVIDGTYGVKIMVKGQMTDIPKMIIQDFRVIKSLPVDQHKKIRINKKEDQKILLGRSPDFADTYMMREWFELKGQMVISEPVGSNSLLAGLQFEPED